MLSVLFLFSRKKRQIRVESVFFLSIFNYT
nr:MAG TPA: hypothetical protein [Caudoviricetes sp.]